MTKRIVAVGCAVGLLLQGRAAAHDEPASAASLSDAFRIVRWTTSEGLPQSAPPATVVLEVLPAWWQTLTFRVS